MQATPPAVCSLCGATFVICTGTKWVPFMAGYTNANSKGEELRPVQLTMAFCNGCENVIELPYSKR